MKIFLIGMPASGKTALGKELAEALSLPFVDLDKEIEAKEGKSIAEIFAQHGEDYFRLSESASLKSWASRTDSFVLATGGGAPCFYDGISIINNAGVSIFLDTPTNELIKRTARQTGRPMFDTASAAEKENKLKELLQKRLPIYEKARLRVKNASVGKVLELLKPLQLV